MSKPTARNRADGLRRELGPVAWCALECLIERADAGTVVVASIRSLAAQLGVAKNTAHRAVATLVRAGIVEVVQTRGTDGQFRPGSYRLHLDKLHATSSAKHTRKRTIAGGTADPAQLSLLPPS